MNALRRPQRVASLLRAELARILIEEAYNPEFQQLVITRVEVSPDLKNASVFYDSLKAKENTLRPQLQRATPFFKRKIGEKIKLRYVPELRFERDRFSESVGRVMHLLDEVKKG